MERRRGWLGRGGEMGNGEDKVVDGNRSEDNGSALVRLRRALALTSVALKFEILYEVGRLDAPLTELNFTHMGRNY